MFFHFIHFLSLFLCFFLKKKTLIINKQNIKNKGEFLFVRFICPALLQLGSYNLLPSRYAVSTATKGVLVLISKVLQKFAEMSYFDPIKEPTMALFNDFIYKHSESVQQYFCSFCVRILIFHFSFPFIFVLYFLFFI